LYQAYTRIHAITHTYILHITGFILKHGSSCIRNHNRNVRLVHSFHTSCSDLDMVKCTLCNEEFETDELLKKHMRICIFCIDQKNIEKWP